MKDVKILAAYVSEHMDIKVDRIIHSGKTRALETAEVMAEYLHPANIEVDRELTPLADPLVWADRLAEMEEEIMLVGHLPHLNKLSSNLLSDDNDRRVLNFQTSGMACIEKKDGVWSIAWMI